jgi:hypothetical protein
MDPLSVSASVIAILDLSAEIIKYINDASGAPKERKRLRDEVRACEALLQDLKDEAGDSETKIAWKDTITALEAPGAPLGRLGATLGILKAELRPREKLRSTLKSLKWPLEAAKVDKFVNAMEREKSLLALALTNNCRKLIQDIKMSSQDNARLLVELMQAARENSTNSQIQFEELKDGLSCVVGSQSGLRDDLNRLNERQENDKEVEKRRAICNWLTPTGYTSIQNDFINRRQAGTGQWLLQSEEYRSWLRTSKQTLFCPGIPGSGKTILTSIVIHDVCERFTKDRTIGVAYIYLNFRKQEEQQADRIFASLLRQLAEGQASITSPLKKLHDKHEARKTRPSRDEILETLQAVIAMHSRVFIFIDALDECQSDRSRLLSEIFTLQKKTGLNFFATSRPILDVKKEFKGCISHESLEIRARMEDISRYLEGRMDRLQVSISERPHLQEEIKKVISQAADGMYVLPYCLEVEFDLLTSN